MMTDTTVNVVILLIGLACIGPGWLVVRGKNREIEQLEAKCDIFKDTIRAREGTIAERNRRIEQLAAENKELRERMTDG